jgi:hypothetical protein
MAVAILSLTLGDDYGRTTTRKYEIDEQVDLTAYAAVITSFLAALQAATDLSCVRADLVLPGFGTGWAVTAGANVDVGATFSGYIEGGDGKKASIKLPGIKASLVDPDGSVPLTGATATWLTEFEDGEDFMLSDGEQIDSWIRGTLDR